MKQDWTLTIELRQAAKFRHALGQKHVPWIKPASGEQERVTRNEVHLDGLFHERLARPPPSDDRSEGGLSG